MFTPISTDPSTMNLVPNGAVGGANWPASSYDPEKKIYVVCSQEGVLGVIAEAGKTNTWKATGSPAVKSPAPPASPPGFLTDTKYRRAKSSGTKNSLNPVIRER